REESKNIHRTSLEFVTKSVSRMTEILGFKIDLASRPSIINLWT
ncbi:unnamed protein product, partial [marine sediment metagenome]